MRAKHIDDIRINSLQEKLDAIEPQPDRDGRFVWDVLLAEEDAPTLRAACGLVMTWLRKARESPSPGYPEDQFLARVLSVKRRLDALRPSRSTTESLHEYTEPLARK